MTLRIEAEALGIRYFLVSFTDLFGVARAKLVPTSAMDDVEENGAAFAGFATWLDMSPSDPDIFAVPDPKSMIQLPWKPEIGWLASDLYMNGEPLPQAPRQLLKKSLSKAADLGYQMSTGVECEFFLLSGDGTAISDPLDAQAKPCYDQQAITRRYDLISRICDVMDMLGWEPYQNDHEDANGQFEMNWKYANALVTADRQTFFKYLVKTMAEEAGFRATFMPKPFSHLTGNGCHMHVSLWNNSLSENVFEDKSASLGLSTTAKQFLGGVLNSAEALTAITNPTVNSYRRIGASTTSSGATWSPNVVSYSGNNRTHMIRIPDAGRFELRLADGAANPYLFPAAVLEAGLEGLKHQRDPGPALDVNIYEDQETARTLRRLPTNLYDALNCLESSEALKAGLGQEFITSYVKLKRQQWNDYSRQVTPWEVEQTLDC
ncbi:MAG: type III glutamate--ammonia ligase [Planctomycetaceae bacterium]